MKLLLDESVPRKLRAEFPPPLSVHTVQDMDWDGIANGELLRLAAHAKFDLFITVDQGLQFQHNLEELPIPVVLMKAGRIRLQELAPLVPAIMSLLAEGLDTGVHVVTNDRRFTQGEA